MSNGSGWFDPNATFDPRALQRLPLVAMNQVVCFPHTVFPFRVRANAQAPGPMWADHDGRLLGLTLPAEDGAPRPVAVLARVLRREALPQGNAQLLLHGLGRVRLLAVPTSGPAPLRSVPAEWLPDRPCAPGPLAAEMRALHASMQQCAVACPATWGALDELLQRGLGPGALADLLCASLIEELAARRRAVTDASVLVRLQMANEGLLRVLCRRPDSLGQAH